MEHRKLQADVVIIGDGIAGLSLAYVAGQNDLNSVILGKNIPGATQAATGFLAPRPDYILHDLELVRRTAYECSRWRQIFHPRIIKAGLFLIPIGPELPASVKKFEALLEFYDRETKERLNQLPSGYFRVNRTILEKMEPNLRRNYFDGALALWEWTVDPNILLEKMHNESVVYGATAKRIRVKEVSDFKVENNCIREVIATELSGNEIRIHNGQKSLIVVNACGSWIPDIWKFFGILLPMELNIGVQAKVPGWYFQSGIITFGPDNKYVVCLQKNGYIQVGPTNGTDDIGYLHSVFANLIDDPAPEASFLKSGYRVKPFAVDTQRPVIWNHKHHGFNNFYSLHPGKMVLALLAADELLAKAKKDGWFGPDIFAPDKKYALNGTSPFKSNLKIRWLAVRSFVAMALYYIRFLFKKPLN